MTTLEELENLTLELEHTRREYEATEKKYWQKLQEFIAEKRKQ